MENDKYISVETIKTVVENSNAKALVLIGRDIIKGMKQTCLSVGINVTVRKSIDECPQNEKYETILAVSEDEWLSVIDNLDNNQVGNQEYCSKIISHKILKRLVESGQGTNYWWNEKRILNIALNGKRIFVTQSQLKKEEQNIKLAVEESGGKLVLVPTEETNIFVVIKDFIPTFELLQAWSRLPKSSIRTEKWIEATTAHPILKMDATEHPRKTRRVVNIALPLQYIKGWTNKKNGIPEASCRRVGLDIKTGTPDPNCIILADERAGPLDAHIVDEIRKFDLMTVQIDWFKKCMEMDRMMDPTPYLIIAKYHNPMSDNTLTNVRVFVQGADEDKLIKIINKYSGIVEEERNRADIILTDSVVGILSEDEQLQTTFITKFCLLEYDKYGKHSECPYWHKPIFIQDRTQSFTELLTGYLFVLFIENRYEKEYVSTALLSLGGMVESERHGWERDKVKFPTIVIIWDERCRVIPKRSMHIRAEEGVVLCQHDLLATIKKLSSREGFRKWIEDKIQNNDWDRYESHALMEGEPTCSNPDDMLDKGEEMLTLIDAIGKSLEALGWIITTPSQALVKGNENEWGKETNDEKYWLTGLVSSFSRTCLYEGRVPNDDKHQGLAQHRLHTLFEWYGLSILSGQSKDGTRVIYSITSDVNGATSVIEIANIANGRFAIKKDVLVLLERRHQISQIILKCKLLDTGKDCTPCKEMLANGYVLIDGKRRMVVSDIQSEADHQQKPPIVNDHAGIEAHGKIVIELGDDLESHINGIKDMIRIKVNPQTRGNLTCSKSCAALIKNAASTVFPIDKVIIFSDCKSPNITKPETFATCIVCKTKVYSEKGVVFVFDNVIQKK